MKEFYLSICKISPKFRPSKSFSPSLLSRKGDTVSGSCFDLENLQHERDKGGGGAKGRWKVGPDRFWIKVNNRGRAEGDVPFDPPCWCSGAKKVQASPTAAIQNHSDSMAYLRDGSRSPTYRTIYSFPPCLSPSLSFFFSIFFPFSFSFVSSPRVFP